MAFVSFCGVNIPVVVNFKLPTWYQLAPRTPENLTADSLIQSSSLIPLHKISLKEMLPRCLEYEGDLRKESSRMNSVLSATLWGHCRLFFFSEGNIELRRARCLLEVFPVAQMVKSLPAMQETRVWSIGWEDPLEKGMAIHSSILAWRIPWTEEPGMLHP